MFHTIKADFYRLLRSKGFWITEGLLLINVALASVLGIVGQVATSSSETAPPVYEASSWTGFGSLVNLSSNLSITTIFTLIILSLLIGVDFSQKLYKNSLTAGISRLEYFLSKTFVLIVVSFAQLILAYLLAFCFGSLAHGIGTMPDHFWMTFAQTIAVQVVCSLAWISIAMSMLYLTHSITSIFVTYILSTIVLGLPVALYPKIELFHYFALAASYDLVTDTNFSLTMSLVALSFFLTFSTFSYLFFRRQDL